MVGLTLKHPFDMGELLELIQQLTPKSYAPAKFQEMPWSGVIQEVFALVPGDKQQRLLQVSWSDLASKRHEALLPIKAWYTRCDHFLTKDYSTWREWLEREGRLESLTLAGELIERGFYVTRELPTPLSPQLLLQFSWTKLQELIRIEDPWKRAFYENECLKAHWSVRQLQRQIESLLYERTGLSTNKKAVIERARRQEPQEKIEDLIRDPYVLEFTGLGERPKYSEEDLESVLLDHLQRFLLELGAGFCFEARQFRITTGNKHHRVDLVFYHRRLRCHVLIDLKIRAFQPADAGQMNFYVNWFKANMMAEGDNPPVGIILCSGRDHTDVEFATAGMDSKFFVSRYLVVLPSAEQLKALLETDRALIESARKAQR